MALTGSASVFQEKDISSGSCLKIRMRITADSLLRAHDAWTLGCFPCLASLPARSSLMPILQMRRLLLPPESETRSAAVSLRAQPESITNLPRFTQLVSDRLALHPGSLRAGPRIRFLLHLCSFPDRCLCRVE